MSPFFLHLPSVFNLFISPRAYCTSTYWHALHMDRHLANHSTELSLEHANFLSIWHRKKLTEHLWWMAGPLILLQDKLQITIKPHITEIKSQMGFLSYNAYKLHSNQTCYRDSWREKKIHLALFQRGQSSAISSAPTGIITFHSTINAVSRSAQERYWSHNMYHCNNDPWKVFPSVKVYTSAFKYL